MCKNAAFFTQRSITPQRRCYQLYKMFRPNRTLWIFLNIFFTLIIFIYPVHSSHPSPTTFTAPCLSLDRFQHINLKMIFPAPLNNR